MKQYSLGLGWQLVLTDVALETLSLHVQRDVFKTEAGGVLLGRHLLESRDIVIDQVTEPQPADKRQRFGFFRSSSHNAIANARWRESGKKTAYLGLWHTHPEPIPTPSNVDLDDWRRALAKDQFEGDYLFFIIVGQQQIGCWLGNKNGAIINLEESDGGTQK